MPETGDEGVDDVERIAANADRHREAWTHTLEDAQALAGQRADEGYETLVLPAVDTAPEPPDSGPSARFGLVYVVPDNFAADVTEMIETATFPVFDVYRATVDGRVFLVTELLDPEAMVVVYVVGTYELRHARALIETVLETGEMYTHLETLDGTHLGSIEHDGYEKFFPDAERVAE